MNVDDITVEQAVGLSMEYLDRGEPCRVVTPNAEFALRAAEEPEFLRVINQSQIILPDGISVVLASKIVGNPIGGKAAGIDFAQQLCGALAGQGKGLFILGARPGVADTAAQRLAGGHPGLVIAGTCHGFYDDEQAVVDAIVKARPDGLLVALGAPRQEYFMQKYGHLFGPCIMVGVGGAVDIMAGNLKRAPRIFVRLGLEWLYRLIKQPSRFGRMARLPLYLWRAAVHRLKYGKQGEANGND